MDGHCANDRCAPLKRQTDAEAIACTKAQSVKESIGDQCTFLFSSSLGPHIAPSWERRLTAWCVCVCR